MVDVYNILWLIVIAYLKNGQWKF